MEEPGGEQDWGAWCEAPKDSLMKFFLKKKNPVSQKKKKMKFINSVWKNLKEMSIWSEKEGKEAL